MKAIGTFCIVAALLLGLYAITMDTSVAVDYSGGNTYGLPTRVNNLGLMNDRQNYLMISGVLLIAGIALIYMGGKSQVNALNQEQSQNKDSTTSNGAYKEDLINKLSQLQELKDKNVIPEEIYVKQKEELLKQFAD